MLDVTARGQEVPEIGGSKNLASTVHLILCVSECLYSFSNCLLPVGEVSKPRIWCTNSVWSIKTPGPNRQKGLKKTFVYHEYEGKRSRGGKLAGRQRRDGVTWRFHLHCTQGCGRRGRLCSRLTDRWIMNEIYILGHTVSSVTTPRSRSLWDPNDPQAVLSGGWNLALRTPGPAPLPHHPACVPRF